MDFLLEKHFLYSSHSFSQSKMSGVRKRNHMGQSSVTIQCSSQINPCALYNSTSAVLGSGDSKEQHRIKRA